MESRVSATEAARRFDDILRRVRASGESFVVEEGGDAICRIIPATPRPGFTGRDFLDLVNTAPRPDPAFADDLKAVVDDQEVKVPGSQWD